MAKNPTSRDKWEFTSELIPYRNILKNRKDLVSQYYQYMLARTARMFKYEGIDQDSLKDCFSIRRCEQLTQVNGYSFLMYVKNPSNGYKEGIYCLNGFGWGDQYSPEGLPTRATINNIALGINETDLVVGKDVVLYPNDSSFIGFSPMFSLYSNMLADIDISLRYALINSRIPSIIQGCDTQMKNDIDKLYLDIEEGVKIGSVVASNPLFDSVKNSLVSDSKDSLIKELLEAKQFIKGNWFLDIGTQSNFNMKRESINESESGLNQDTLIPFPDDMKHNREESWKKILELGWIKEPVTIEFDSSWHKIHEEYSNPTEEKESLKEEGEQENDIEG